MTEKKGCSTESPVCTSAPSARNASTNSSVPKPWAEACCSPQAVRTNDATSRTVSEKENLDFMCTPFYIVDSIGPYLVPVQRSSVEGVFPGRTALLELILTPEQKRQPDWKV